MRHGIALARFCLDFVAVLLGFDAPELEFGLRGALAEADDVDAAAQIEALARKHRRAYADHKRLVEPSVAALRGARVDASAWRLMAATALHALRSMPARWGVGDPRGELARAIDAAFRASSADDARGVVSALGGIGLVDASREVAHALQGVAEAYGGGSDEIVERMEVARPRRTTPPPGFDLDRGRKSRADLVLAVLRSHDVQLREPERGRLRVMTRDDLAEAILRDPFWDDIDASTQEDGVVEGILRGGRPSPAIDGRAFGQEQVFIKRIVR